MLTRLSKFCAQVKSVLSGLFRHSCDEELQLPQKYNDNFDVSTEGHSWGKVNGNTRPSCNQLDQIKPVFHFIISLGVGEIFRQ